MDDLTKRFRLRMGVYKSQVYNSSAKKLACLTLSYLKLNDKSILIQQQERDNWQTRAFLESNNQVNTSVRCRRTKYTRAVK